MTARLFNDIRKDADTGDVHVSTALGNDKGKKKKPKDDIAKYDWSISVPVAKLDEEQRCVYGWASVISEGGQVVTDLQGDQIEVGDLVKAAHDFMLASREGGDMHEVVGIGKVVESMVLTPAIQQTLGIDLKKIGWLIGMKISDDGVWARAKSGELAAFSIGGSGARVPT